MASPCWGFRDPSRHAPAPSPTATHLDISVHDAQVVEVHWGQDRAISACVPSQHSAHCHTWGWLTLRSLLVGTVVAVPSVEGHSPSTSTSSAANRRTVASAKQPAVRHSACRSPVLQ